MHWGDIETIHMPGQTNHQADHDTITNFFYALFANKFQRYTIYRNFLGRRWLTWLAQAPYVEPPRGLPSSERWHQRYLQGSFPSLRKHQIPAKKRRTIWNLCFFFSFQHNTAVKHSEFQGDKLNTFCLICTPISTFKIKQNPAKRKHLCELLNIISSKSLISI